MFVKQNTLIAGWRRVSFIAGWATIRTDPRVISGHIGDTTQTMQIRLAILFHDCPPYEVTLRNSYCSVSFKTTNRFPKNGIEPAGVTRKLMEHQERNVVNKSIYYDLNIVKKKMGNIII